MIELKVKFVAKNQGDDFTILLLDNEEKHVLPIVVGPFEAQAIMLPMEGIEPPRPLTHDLLMNFCRHYEKKLSKIVITGIREHTYYAELHLQDNGRTDILDSRPSDAIALALRCRAPIYMTPGLIEFTYDFADIKFEQEEGGEESH